MVIRYGEGGARIEGKDLTKYMSALNEYLGFFDKVSKRLRNEEVVTAFAEIFANEGKDPARRADFESADKLKQMRSRLKDMERKHQFKSVSDVEFDEEHQTYSVTFVDSQGAPRKIDWTLAAAAESRQLLNKHAQIREQLVGPFLIEYAAKEDLTKPGKAELLSAAEEAAATQAQAEQDLENTEEVELEGAVDVGAAPVEAARPVKRNAKASHDPVEKKTPREVFEYVVEQGKKEYQVQRYKGLGEMTAPQLWETTMDPAKRTLLQVRLEDITATELIFSTLMGEDVEARRKFIEENALDVKNLDI
jgi:DNA gyrase subunit B